MICHERAKVLGALRVCTKNVRHKSELHSVGLEDFADIGRQLVLRCFAETGRTILDIHATLLPILEESSYFA